MNNIENPTAFPMPESSNGQWPAQSGMTLRDYFAAKADVTPYCPVEAWMRTRNGPPTIQQLADYIAQIRYIEADAMLKLRAPAAGKHEGQQ